MSTEIEDVEVLRAELSGVEWDRDCKMTALEMAAQEIAIARTALKQIAELDNVRDENERAPMVVALDRWNRCVEIAKDALKRMPAEADEDAE